MKISTKGRYALRLMLDIAEYGEGEWVSLKDVSRRQEISVKYLEQIVNMLVRANMLLSARGAHGGYKLAKPPKEYTVGGIVRAIEGSLAPVDCLDGPENTCPRRGECMTLPFWEGLDKVITDYMDSYTLADLIDNARTPDDYTI